MIQPVRYNIFMLHDDKTPMDFIVQVIVEIFGKDKEKAIDLMMEIYNNKHAIVGTYSKEIAIEKCLEVFHASIYYNFPLTTRLKEIKV